MESRLFWLTMKAFRSLDYQLPNRNGSSHRFNNNTGMAGVNRFLAKHPTLSIRTPEIHRIQVVVSQFFSLLNQMIDMYKLMGENIFDCDDSGSSVNLKSQSKIISLKGKGQVGALTSAERGDSVTAAMCMSAARPFIPPCLSFQRRGGNKNLSLVYL